MEDQFVKSIAKKIESIEKQEGKVQKWTIIEGIAKFQEYCIKRNLSYGTISTYDVFIDNFSSWLKKTKQEELIASEITEDIILNFLNQYCTQKQWKPRTYNNHLKFFNTLFSRMFKMEHKENKEIVYLIDLSDI